MITKAGEVMSPTSMKLKIAICGVAFCAVACAQRSTGYFFIAPGGITSNGHTAMSLQMGAGGDVILGKGAGIGAELSAIGPRQDFASSVLGAFSPNLSYHFIHDPSRKVDPYITGGYTLLFRTEHLNLVNFGLGTNYWLAHRLGLHLEFRDQIYTQNGSMHLWGVRVGIAVR
jgi:hypothetical protein